jgi:hypothetical protein
MSATFANRRLGRATASDRNPLRGLPLAGLVYVLAWIVGPVVAPAAPENSAPAAEIHSYFTAHAGASVVQALLVHGIAGLALIALALGFAAALDDSRFAGAIRVTGVAAAAVSLVQFGFAVAVAHDITGTDADTARAWFRAINYADTLKLVLLAAFVTVVTEAAGRVGAAPRWLRVLGRVLAPLLVLGGLAFVVDNALLDVLLEISLVILLVWAGTSAWRIGRSHP